MIKERYIFLQKLNTDIVVYLDPLLDALLSFFEPDSHLISLSQSAGMLLFFFLLTAFWAYLLPQKKDRSCVIALLAAAVLTSSLSIISSGMVYGSSVLYFLLFPLLILFLSERSTNRFLKYVLFFWGVIISGPLAFIFTCLSKASKNNATYVNNSMVNSKFSLWTSLWTAIQLILALGISLYFSSRSQVFDYPRNAQLIYLSPMNVMGDVFFAPDKKPFPLDIHAFVQMNQWSIRYVIFLTLPGLFLFFYKPLFSFLRERKIQNLGLSYHVLILFLFVLIGTYMTSIGKYPLSPEAVLFKSVPGLVSVPLPYLFSALYMLVFFSILLADYERKKISFCLALQAALLLAIMPFVDRGAFYPFKNNEVADAKLLKDIVFSKDKFIEEPFLMAYTPSRFLIDTYLEGRTEKVSLIKEKREPLKVVSLKDASCVATASKHAEQAALVLDGEHKTRWSTKGPQQEGDWFEIYCEKPVSVNQIHLSISLYKSDFPRGLKIQSSLNGESREFLSYKDWYGSIQFTDIGLPYFGPQSDVVLDFPNEIRADKFRFILTKNDEVFDWSIAKLIFLQ